MKEAKSVPLTHIYMIHSLSWLGNCKVVNESPIKFYRTLFLGNVMSKTCIFRYTGVRISNTFSLIQCLRNRIFILYGLM